jgi:hypothetical protein
MATIAIDERFGVDAPPAAVWGFLVDPRRMVGCVPGGELERVLDDRTFDGAVRVMGASAWAVGMLVGHAGLPSDLPPSTIIVAEPLSETFAPARRMAKLLATALAGTLLVALAVALLAARRVTQPLTELTGVAATVGRLGWLGLRLP